MRKSDDYVYSPTKRSGLSRKAKRQIIAFLRFFILIMLILILGLSGFLVTRAIFFSDDSHKSTDSSHSSQSSSTDTTADTATLSPTPAITAAAELLTSSEVVENYFGPLPVAESVETVTHEEIHAIYIGACGNIDANIALAQNSEINAFVIDLKEADGIKFNSTNATAIQVGDIAEGAYNLSSVIQKCHDAGIIVIGRIVCFKDPILAAELPDYCIKDADGNVLQFAIEGDDSFVNPYDTRNWDYNIDIALEAVTAGIDEIQFDYVRFPSGRTTSGATPYFGEDGVTPTKQEVINRFLQTARIRIQDEYGVPISADVFGIILSSSSDGQLIGQGWDTIGLTGIDSVCPMIYPSHYSSGTMMNGHTYDYPDLYPFDVVSDALALGSDEDSVAGYATVRPYLQAFTASYLDEGHYMTYDYAAINEQIRAVEAAGFSEWVLWNPSAKYPEGAYDGA